ncbi:MAG: hypothetical protein M9954_09490 [Cyclobacteriaceae bacterium]|nr:hypothetical protein [Cyclobacteriaceae bacterium]MCB0499190.1 hypothetical protein [Cyclobacteriaceae bacterium]MCB9237970.1 hypothetical protein [Flammeovirgaceae bacterium]MCO5271880.1 hypothetical protein [Cyclobacteriaceae bacterium]MCW5901706.1 hypothetical protein [Cyclobacteriaceae bacterium]
MRFFGSHNKRDKNSVVLYPVLLLLVIYLTGTVEVNSFHALLHPPENQKELHTMANEANGCHQWVYHNNGKPGCGHKAHLVANKKCPLCHLTLQSFHYASIKPADCFFISIALPFGEWDADVAGRTTTHLPCRAPPTA